VQRRAPCRGQHAGRRQGTTANPPCGLPSAITDAQAGVRSDNLGRRTADTPRTRRNPLPTRAPPHRSGRHLVDGYGVFRDVGIRTADLAETRNPADVLVVVRAGSTITISRARTLSTNDVWLPSRVIRPGCRTSSNDLVHCVGDEAHFCPVGGMLSVTNLDDPQLAPPPASSAAAREHSDRRPGHASQRPRTPRPTSGGALTTPMATWKTGAEATNQTTLTLASRRDVDKRVHQRPERCGHKPGQRPWRPPG